jgi:MFS transporter, SP family, general alpha glucoside:H+ symporter
MTDQKQITTDHSEIEPTIGLNVEGDTINAEAQLATAAEHALTVREAFKSYPAAVLWAIVMSFTIVMESYDSGLMNNFYA